MSKEELYSAMGERLRGERTKLGYTQEKMAEKLGMSLTYYGQIERGISGISLEKLVLAHECLNIDPTYLLTGKERPVVSFDLDVYKRQPLRQIQNCFCSMSLPQV